MPFDKGIKNKKLYDYCQGGPNFPMDQALPDQRVEVSIFLTSAQNIKTIKDSLQRDLPDLECKEQGNVITVSGYPMGSNDFGASILAVVQKIDQNAYMQN